MADNRMTNIAVYRKKRQINVGIIIFGAVFFYLLVSVLMYLTSKHVSAYEVREGSIVKDTAYTGFVVREEKLIHSDKNGYVNYFAPEGSKVGARTSVYTSSDNKLSFQSSASKSDELSSEEESAMLVKIQSFSENFKEDSFRDIYSVKDSVKTILESKSSQNRQSQLSEILTANTGTVNVYKGTVDGVVFYSYDGFESTSANDVTEDMISGKSYEKKLLTNNQYVKANDPVYRLVTGDSWSVIVPLDEDMAKTLKNQTVVKVRFSKDNETATAGLTIKKKDGTYFAYLTFRNGMIRYADERFLDLELILEDESGLKIPKSSVVKKDFYAVPEDYLTQGGNSNRTGVLVDTGADNAEFQAETIYYRDTKSGLVYLNPADFKDGAVLIKPDSTQKYELKRTKSLKGVYNINKGYAVFKQVKILCKSDEYYIVEAGNDYGLSNYDHIALDGKSINDNDIVFE